MKVKKDHLKLLKLVGLAVLIIILVFAAYSYFKPKPTYPMINSTDHIRGNLNANIKIVEFSDFQCPACGRAEPIVEEIFQTYKDNISLEYKHFPLTSIHRYAFKAAEASECAGDQGRFWEMHDIMFAMQKDLSTDALKEYAKEIGLDEQNFTLCLDSSAKEETVKEDMRLAMRLNLPGTPSFFVNDKQIEFQTLADLETNLITAIEEAQKE